MGDFDQKKYVMEYEKENVRRVVIKVNRKTMPEISEKLESLGKRKVQPYILDLIRADIRMDAIRNRWEIEEK